MTALPTTTFLPIFYIGRACRAGGAVCFQLKSRANGFYIGRAGRTGGADSFKLKSRENGFI